jgi:hypothetical protein
MKISIGTNIKDGPWGGGNLFAINLRDFLIKKGHEVVQSLDDDDIDIILLTEPRKTSESSAFTHIDIAKYINYIKKDSVVIHRVNECDERKNTNYVNQYLIEANKIADSTIFVSSWLQKLFLSQGMKKERSHVVLSGANKEIFNTNDVPKLKAGEKLGIVTHHWGSNWNKGFNIYSKLDKMLDDEALKKRFSFTYIGNVPKNFRFNNSLVVKPLSGVTLAKEIKKHHIYLTASLNEPSGNHHIEGAQCGLPLLYIESGGIPEYCENYGLSFSYENFEENLNKILDNYQIYLEKVKKYPLNSDIMCKNYLNIIENLFEDKHAISKNRNIEFKPNPVDKFIFLFIRKISKLLKNI